MNDWPTLTPEKAAELKREHSGEKLRADDLDLPPEAGGGTVTVVWREPTYDDWDAAQAADRRANEDVQAGNNHFVRSLLAWPDGKHVEALLELPYAVNTFVSERLLPFLGFGTKIRSREL